MHFYVGGDGKILGFWGVYSDILGFPTVSLLGSMDLVSSARFNGFEYGVGFFFFFFFFFPLEKE